MLSRLREHLGSAGLIVAIVALVAALAGGAIAANSGPDGKATASAAKGKQGPRGKTGKTGPQGPAGPAGPAGPQGPKGDTGAPGSNGANGTNGVTGPTGATGPTGKEGKTGPTGTSGFTEFLPSGETETGVWRFESEGEPKLVKNGEDYELTTATDPFQYTPISFPIPLSSSDAEEISYGGVPKGGTPTANCPGTVENPDAEPGYLCVYASGFESDLDGAPSSVFKPVATAAEVEGVVGAGAVLYWENIAPGKQATGTFAVTAP